MPRLPARLQDFLSFLNSHASLWDTNHTALGLSATQSAQLKAAATSAQGFYDAQVTAMQQAKAATVKQQDSVRDARQLAADAIRSISAFAEQQANPNAVYTLAQIDPPQPATPSAPPGTPTDFKAQLNTDGSIKLTWKAENPSGAAGTVWIVRRKLNNETAYVQVGIVGTRTFTDATIPSSSGGASYSVQGQRAASLGQASNPFTVQFGIDGGGLMIAAQFTESKKAA